MHQHFASFSCYGKVVLRRILLPESSHKISATDFTGERARKKREERGITCVIVLPLVL